MSEETVGQQRECPFCNEKINVNAKKCKHCGEIVDVALRAVEEMKRTNNTGPVIVNNNNNNSNGGQPQTIYPQAGMFVPKSRTTYVILGLLLGWLGAHNFYAGYAGRGIIQLLLTCTVFGIFIVGLWVLIEVITVKCDARGILFS